MSQGPILESPTLKAQAEDQHHILVIDDDAMMCMAIETSLQRSNFKLERHRFDLMLVDIFMPHMRGFESIRVFHETAPTVPLIAMSGYVFADHDGSVPDFLRMALELGAARCLRKPFTPDALLAIINECLLERDACGRGPLTADLR